MRFECPNCNGIVEIDDSEAGQPVECGYCGNYTIVPKGPLAKGAVIDDFRMEQKLGEGGVAEVYRAYQLSLQRDAAMKILHDKYQNDETFIKQFIFEARMAAKINHPNIVQAYAVGEEYGLYFFAMEYVKGQMLKDVLSQSERLVPERALSIIGEVAKGLAEAWNRQELVHRDIKPDNIMITNDREVKLADLGLARPRGDLEKLAAQQEESDNVFVTPQYAAPEQLLDKLVDNRSDIYSLGATLYHCVTGRFPFLGNTPLEIARKHITESLVPPEEIVPGIPASVSTLIELMMAKRPAHRIQSAEALLAEIDRIQEGDMPSRDSCPELQDPLDVRDVDEDLAQTELPEGSLPRTTSTRGFAKTRGRLTGSPLRSTASMEAQHGSSGSRKTVKRRYKRHGGADESDIEAGENDETVRMPVDGGFRKTGIRTGDTHAATEAMDKVEKAKGSKNALIAMLIFFLFLILGGIGAVLYLATTSEGKTKYPDLTKEETQVYETILKEDALSSEPEEMLELIRQAMADHPNGNLPARLTKVAVPYLEEQIRERRAAVHDRQKRSWRLKARVLRKQENAYDTYEKHIKDLERTRRELKRERREKIRNLSDVVRNWERRQKRMLQESIDYARDYEFMKARRIFLELANSNVNTTQFADWRKGKFPMPDLEKEAREEIASLKKLVKWAEGRLKILAYAEKAFDRIKNSGTKLKGFHVAVPGGIAGKIKKIDNSSITALTEKVQRGKIVKKNHEIFFANLSSNEAKKLIEEVIDRAEANGAEFEENDLHVQMASLLLAQERQADQIREEVNAVTMHEDLDLLQEVLKDMEARKQGTNL